MTREGSALAWDVGEVFVALQRKKYKTELRLALHWGDPVARKGPFVRLGSWRDGFPVAGDSVRISLREIAALTDALGRILAAVEGDAPPPVTAAEALDAAAREAVRAVEAVEGAAVREGAAAILGAPAGGLDVRG